MGSRTPHRGIPDTVPIPTIPDAERVRVAPADLRTQVGDLSERIVDIVGVTGSNGKLGALKERVDKAEARRWFVVTFLAGLLVTTISAAIVFGRWMGTMETDIATIKRQLGTAGSGTPTP